MKPGVYRQDPRYLIEMIQEHPQGLVRGRRQMDRDAGQSLLKPFEPRVMCLMRGGSLQYDLENHVNFFFFGNSRSNTDNRIRDLIRQKRVAVRHRDDAGRFQTREMLMEVGIADIFRCHFDGFLCAVQFRFAQSKELRSRYEPLQRERLGAVRPCFFKFLSNLLMYVFY